jgi:hypothetical protein
MAGSDDRTTGMAKTLNDLPPRAALVEIARDFHARGWMSGTAGNLSVRADDDNFWITASGRPKGRLDESDFLLVRIQDGEVVERAAPGNKPSAETAIHRTIYSLFPDAQTCLHGHSVDGCLVSGRAKRVAKALRLPAMKCSRVSISGSRTRKWTCRCSRTHSMWPRSPPRSASAWASGHRRSAHS